jgi:lipopolysaccharide export system permease protein
VRIVSRYLLRQFLAASALIFAGLIITALSVGAVLHLDQFQTDVGQAWRLTLFRALEIVPLGLPIACLSGAAWSLTRATRFLELTAIRSGGIRLRRVLAPFLIAAVVLGGAVALFEDRILIPLREVLRESEETETSVRMRRAFFANDRWWFARGSSLFTARAYDPESFQLAEVTVFELDDERRVLRRIDAQEARFLHGQTWELREARILDFGEGEAPALRQESQVQLALGVSRKTLRQALPPPEVTSLHRLSRWIREWSGSPLRIASFEAAFHARLAQPFAVLVFVLLAVGLSVGQEERSDTFGRALLRGLIAATLYWTAWTAALLAAGTGAVPPALPVWGVTGLFLLAGVFIYRRIPE